MGFFKITLGEINPFTLGFLGKSQNMVGSKIAVDFNPIRIRDYSTMYTSPNGYFFFFILLINLIGVRSFTKSNKEEDPIDTKLPSRADVKDYEQPKHRRRSSINIEDIEIHSAKSELNSESQIEIKKTRIQNPDQSVDSTPQPSSRKIELFEKDFSIEMPENLSQINSETSNIQSLSSLIFLQKFDKLDKKNTVISILLRLKYSAPFYEKSRPKLVLFWMMTYSNFKRLSLSLMTYYALTFYLSGNSFVSDLLIGYLLGRVYTRFYFNVFER
jgi:hypothetical protein